MKHYRKTNRKPLVELYAYVFAIMYLVGSKVFNVLDWIGNKLVYLIDNSDFFAGCVWTYVVLSAWELLTRG